MHSAFPRTPLLLFTYNRPRHVERTLAALARCTGLEKCRTIIYCDGLKSPVDAETVAESRSVARQWASRLGAELIERNENLGLAHSIVDSVSHHLAKDGRVIVLEDDLVPTPDFIEFMLCGLERYADASEVAQISGSFLPGQIDIGEDGFFLPLTTTWGWATWARAWREFRWEKDIDPSELDRDSAFRARFTLDGAVDYAAMLRDRLAGANDSWGILWWFAVARSSKLVLYPRESLIWNGGFDNSGVHCGASEKFRPDPPAAFRQRRLPNQIRLPDEIAADARALEAVRNYLSGASSPANPNVSARRAHWLRRLLPAAWLPVAR